MIRAGFLDAEAERDLIELARDGSVEHRLGRRANALLLLNNGMSCAAVAKVLFIDDDSVRTWHRLYEEDGIEGLAGFGHEGSSCRLNLEQQDKLKAWIGETLPRSTRQIGAYIEKEFKIAYEGRSGLIALYFSMKAFCLALSSLRGMACGAPCPNDEAAQSNPSAPHRRS